MFCVPFLGTSAVISQALEVCLTKLSISVSLLYLMTTAVIICTVRNLLTAFPANGFHSSATVTPRVRGDRLFLSVVSILGDTNFVLKETPMKITYKYSILCITK